MLRPIVSGTLIWVSMKHESKTGVTELACKQLELQAANVRHHMTDIVPRQPDMQAYAVRRMGLPGVEAEASARLSEDVWALQGGG